MPVTAFTGSRTSPPAGSGSGTAPNTRSLPVGTGSQLQSSTGLGLGQLQPGSGAGQCTLRARARSVSYMRGPQAPVPVLSPAQHWGSDSPCSKTRPCHRPSAPWTKSAPHQRLPGSGPSCSLNWDSPAMEHAFTQTRTEPRSSCKPQLSLRAGWDQSSRWQYPATLP